MLFSWLKNRYSYPAEPIFQVDLHSQKVFPSSWDRALRPNIQPLAAWRWLHTPLLWVQNHSVLWVNRPNWKPVGSWCHVVLKSYSASLLTHIKLWRTPELCVFYAESFDISAVSLIHLCQQCLLTLMNKPPHVTPGPKEIPLALSTYKGSNKSNLRIIPTCLALVSTTVPRAWSHTKG